MVQLSLAAEVEVALPAYQGHVLEGLVLGFPVHEIRSGERIAAGRGFGLVQPHQLAGAAIRQRPQQDGVDDAEDRAVGADPDGQRNHRNGRESR